MVNELRLVDPVMLWRQILLLFFPWKKHVFLYSKRLMISFNHLHKRYWFGSQEICTCIQSHLFHYLFDLRKCISIPHPISSPHHHTLPRFSFSASILSFANKKKCKQISNLGFMSFWRHTHTGFLIIENLLIISFKYLSTCYSSLLPINL